MIYALSITAALLVFMFLVAMKHEVGPVVARWAASRRARDGDPREGDAEPGPPPSPSDYLVAATWIAGFLLFVVFAIALIRVVAVRGGGGS